MRVRATCTRATGAPGTKRSAMMRAAALSMLYIAAITFMIAAYSFAIA
jgi:hypothetical protein